ncbi:MAG: bifunctional heptose 7-phosphate kinase/heptose 1-phosphate adenyltransferase [Alphaproteobacteria bacterium]|nr:MAG: bifunctional heptose 7-phosphate kinase/heptose 1-phosphate adenyltransferase [Alphaproteobacteria bacterium]
MVDHYVSGRVSRVSDEAPVPIIQVMDERWTAGGAANVAANVAALGGKALLVGVTGADAAASTLAGTLSTLSSAIETHLVTEPGRPTTIKTRYMGSQHQIVRVDRENPGAIERATEDRLIAAVDLLAGDCDVIMISDYAKGALTDRVLAAIMAAGQKTSVPIVVDPKRNDWSAYRGASIITPNRKELQLATHATCGSDAECGVASDIAIATTGAAILLTRSEHGMSLFRQDAAPVHLAAKAREVFDVSGAGDTVAAAVALGVAAGLSPEISMQIANVAAGIVVAKRGTATATPAELLAEIGAGRSGLGGAPGALPLAEAKRLRETWGREGLSVGFTNGCFDILHAGHISLLRQAAAACDRLIVALNTDASVQVLKGPERPVQAEDVRAAVIAAVKGVDAVILFGEPTPLEAISELQPDVLIKGADYSEDQIVGADIVRGRGGRIVRATLVDGQSTTKVIEKSRRLDKG